MPYPYVEDACYAMAYDLAIAYPALEGDHEPMREDIRADLLNAFPGLEGPRIAEIMDAAIREAAEELRV